MGNVFAMDEDYYGDSTKKAKQVEYLDDTDLDMSDDDESQTSADIQDKPLPRKAAVSVNIPDPNEVGWPTDLVHLTKVEC